jgi:3'-5' exonuclease
MNHEELENLLFLDIETASGTERYDELSEGLQKHWARRAKRMETDEPFVSAYERDAFLYEDRAGIFAEFNRVVCISCGYLKWNETHFTIRLKSFYGPTEADILNDFGQVLQKIGNRRLCGHNIREFDYPVLGRRFLVNRIPLPPVLQAQGRKPWENPILDTMEYWKFGDGKNFTALELLCILLDVPTPKSDIDGSQVSRVFWKDQDFARIAQYCENDVAATAHVLLKLVGHAGAEHPLGMISESGF